MDRPVESICLIPVRILLIAVLIIPSLSWAGERVRAGTDVAFRDTGETGHGWNDYRPGISEIKIPDEKDTKSNSINDSYENYYKERSTHKNETGGPLKKNKSRGADERNGSTYRVKNRDTLYGISKKLHLSMNDLASCNGLAMDARLTRDMVLKIPGCRTNGLRVEKPVQGDRNASTPAKVPRFSWPVNRVMEYKSDEANGVKSIGLIIFGKPGSPVLSSSRGTVKKIGKMRGFGKYIIVEHSDRYATVYSNLGEICVTQGQSVNAGREIGKIDPVEKKLHFQIDYAGKPQNPLKFLPKKS